MICDQSKSDNKGCHGAPDWIIEIVSAGSKQMDYLIKLFKYQDAGVKEYWIVDSEKDRITVYNFVHDTIEEYSSGDDIPVSWGISFVQKNIELVGRFRLFYLNIRGFCSILIHKQGEKTWRNGQKPF